MINSKYIPNYFHLDFFLQLILSITDSVLVIITEGEALEILNNPPLMWNPSAVFFISCKIGYDATDLVKTKFGYKIASASSLTPFSELTANNQNENNKKITYKLSTMYPFENNRVSSLRNLDFNSLLDFHSLFPDRFNNFNGQELEIASGVADEPLFYFDENNRYSGICKNILDFLEITFNFTAKYYEDSTDGNFFRIII